MKTKTNTKTLLILILILLLGNSQNIAQNIGIGSESFTPDPSAMLEVKSTEKGFLLPKMTTDERDEIVNPAIGLLIFNLDCENFNVYTSNGWITVNNVTAAVNISATPSGPICGTTPITYSATDINGGTVPTFQWLRNGEIIDGEISSSYVDNSPVNGDIISCVMTSNYPCVSGSPATSVPITQVVAIPPAATVSYTGSPYCSSSGGFANATLIGTTGGNFTSSPTGLSINSGTGTVDIANSSNGTYTVTYTIPASGGCSSFATTTPFLLSSYQAGSQTFNYSGAIQYFTVPCATTITIHAYGAQGGNSNGYAGGKGAYIYGTFNVTPGQVLGVLVGQQGSVGSFYNAGGGGGSFVWNTSDNNSLLIAAGGGGGAGNNNTGNHAQITTSTNGGNGAGGTNGGGGSGGASGSNWAGGGGGSGWIGNGTNGATNGIYIGGGGGFAPLLGNGAGGSAGYNGGNGGFGGGGGGAHASGGGGGGYNGGGGGSANTTGGGAGSFIYGTVSGFAGYQSGNGQIVISW